MRPTITAHSGCEGTPDGSMASILRAVELGADAVEVDVRRVPGLGLALAHDEGADPATLVTLRAALEAVKKHPRVLINCDLKEYGLAPEVLALAEAVGLPDGQMAFSGSLTPRQLAADPAIARRARVYLNIEEVLSELYREANPGEAPGHPWGVASRIGERLEGWIDPLIARCAGANPHALNLPPKPWIEPFLARLGAAVRISAWTIDEPGAMRALLERPWLDNLTTRQVALALEVRAALRDERGKDPCR